MEWEIVLHISILFNFKMFFLFPTSVTTRYSSSFGKTEVWGVFMNNYFSIFMIMIWKLFYAKI